MMIPIVAGWGKDAKLLAYLGIMKCHHCKNYDHFYLYEVAKEVSAFFVRVAKWGRKYYLVCNVCEAAYGIDKSAKDEFLRASVEIPSEEGFAAIWNSLTATVDDSSTSDADLEAAIDATVASLENEYPEAHVQYVCGVYGEYLQDDDKPG